MDHDMPEPWSGIANSSFDPIPPTSERGHSAPDSFTFGSTPGTSPSLGPHNSDSFGASTEVLDAGIVHADIISISEGPWTPYSTSAPSQGPHMYNAEDSLIEDLAGTLVLSDDTHDLTPFIGNPTEASNSFDAPFQTSDQEVPSALPSPPGNEVSELKNEVVELKNQVSELRTRIGDLERILVAGAPLSSEMTTPDELVFGCIQRGRGSIKAIEHWPDVIPFTSKGKSCSFGRFPPDHTGLVPVHVWHPFVVLFPRSCGPLTKEELENKVTISYQAGSDETGEKKACGECKSPAPQPFHACTLHWRRAECSKDHERERNRDYSHIIHLEVPYPLKCTEVFVTPIGQTVALFTIPNILMILPGSKRRKRDSSAPKLPKLSEDSVSSCSIRVKYDNLEHKVFACHIVNKALV